MTSLLSKATSSRLVSDEGESLVYSITTSGGNFILKEPIINKFQNYEFEALAYTKLKELGAKVPTVKSSNNSHLLMTVIAGEPLDKLVTTPGLGFVLSSAAKQLVLCRKIQFSGFGQAIKLGNGYAGECSTWSDYLTSFEYLFDGKYIPADLNKKIREYWQSTRHLIDLEHGTLVHGDFAMSAIMADKEGFTGLIDFGDALIGDPLMDLAYFRYKDINKPYGQNNYNHFLKSYIKAANLEIDQKLDQIIIFYMIYWGLRRLSSNQSSDNHQAFKRKLELVAELI